MACCMKSFSLIHAIPYFNLLFSFQVYRIFLRLYFEFLRIVLKKSCDNIFEIR